MTKEEAISVFETWIERDKKMEDADRLENIEIYNIAIQVLKQQPCEDCISREAVRELICQNNDKYGYSDRFHEFTEKCLHLPPVTPQQPRWIPVSEKLPTSDEEYHTFLVTDSKGNVTLSEFYLSILDRKPYWSGMIDVIAWMPLPQRYKAESEDKE